MNDSLKMICNKINELKISPYKLRKLANFLDVYDAENNNDDHEVQKDLRILAEQIEDLQILAAIII